MTNRNKTLFALALCWLFCVFATAPLLAQAAAPVTVAYTYSSNAFPLVHGGKAANIYVDPAAADVVKIAATALQKDIQLTTNATAGMPTGTKSLSGYPVILGTVGQSALIDRLLAAKKIDVKKVKGLWETFAIAVVANPLPNVKQALVIYGSDNRGTAFGVFELSRLIGVSPLVWWADVTPAHHEAVYVLPGTSIVGPPSVQYRGIFLNDEDWGLRPWAARNMDADKKDIGPRTYEKVFELLLRLKANYIWPAMHPGTKAFWYYKENPEVARRYDIVLGSSHHEPMLRNTEFEWNENYKEEYGKEHGDWRYDTNRDEIYRFFDDRVKESVHNKAFYTVGMRGTGDGGMGGPATVQGKVKILEDVIRDQRQILANRLGKPAAQIPQVFCPYKEVLPLYQAGLKLPDDITITWVDDNHGYIRQLPNPAEQKRSGGNGVYYHFSYWGTPQDYLWLCSTSPSLTAYEMGKAYHFKARKLWVFNVGDLKPAEMELQFAMDFAWNVAAWPPEKASQYPLAWARETFGDAYAVQVAAIKADYYRLAASGKPEHVDRVPYTDTEAAQRLNDYQQLANRAEKLAAALPARLQNAYVELVLYPVEGAKLMNEKILYAKKAKDPASADSAGAFAAKAQQAYNKIQVLTKEYNEGIAGGKWNGIMDAQPRDLAPFRAPQDLKFAANSMISSGGENKAPLTVIPASAYQQKTEQPGLLVKVVDGLGISGKGVTVLPYPDSSFTNVGAAPYVVYKLQLAKGENRITVKCLPTFRVYDGLLLRYGIAVGNGPVEVVDLASKAETKPWEANVLRGYTQGQTIYNAANAGETTVRIYLPDPGLVVSQLEVQPL